MEMVALVALLALVEYFVLGGLVGRYRGKQVPAPAMTGPPEFERTLRAQLNMAERLVIFLPALWLGWRAAFGDLGANPVETITHETGEWSLRLLLVTLAVTPLRRLTGWLALTRLRRWILEPDFLDVKLGRDLGQHLGRALDERVSAA